MVLEKDLGSSLLFFTLFLVHALGGDRAGLVPGRRDGAVRGRRLPGVLDRSATCRSGSTSGSTPGTRPRAATRSSRPRSPSPTGGVAGTGPGPRRAEQIPVVESDFIFAVIGEELGLLGATAILIAFVLMIGAGLRIAQQATSPFEKLLATGLTTLLGFQAFIIMAGVTRLLPLTGVTLPFVSYGGSSLLANYVLLALLMRISDDDRVAAAPTAASLAQHDHEDRPDEQADPQPRRVPRDLLRPAVPPGQPAHRCSTPRTCNAKPGNNRAVERDFNRPRGTIETTDGVVAGRVGRRRTTGSSSSASTRGRAVRPRHRLLLLPVRLRRRRAEYNDELAGRTIDFDLESFGDLFVDRERVGNVVLTVRNDVQQVASDAARRPEGLGRGARPAHRRDPRHVVGPSLRPEPAVDPRLHRRRRRVDGAQRRPRRADPVAGVPRSGTSPARRSRS